MDGWRNGRRRGRRFRRRRRRRRRRLVPSSQLGEAPNCLPASKCSASEAEPAASPTSHKCDLTKPATVSQPLGWSRPRARNNRRSELLAIFSFWVSSLSSRGSINLHGSQKWLTNHCNLHLVTSAAEPDQKDFSFRRFYWQRILCVRFCPRKPTI